MSMIKRYLESIGFFEESEIDDHTEEEFDWKQHFKSLQILHEVQEESDTELSSEL